MAKLDRAENKPVKITHRFKFFHSSPCWVLAHNHLELNSVITLEVSAFYWWIRIKTSPVVCLFVVVVIIIYLQCTNDNLVITLINYFKEQKKKRKLLII